nr:adenylosuccinate lyase [Maliibacterium massiliense]
MKETYESPFASRYASAQMQRLFSPDHKFQTWRRLWVALAQSEMELGLPITQHQVDQMRAHMMDINYDVAAQREAEVRHDVMAHVYAYGVQCPEAAGIMHLGATSCYVTDNTDVLILRDALALVEEKLSEVIRRLARFALAHKDMPMLGLTHLQPAQLVTVGKRASLWVQDFLMDLEDVRYVQGTLKLLGNKGTTGTQASFMALFDGDEQKVVALERKIAEKMGMDAVYPVSGQTYPRKLDSRVVSALSGVAQSAYKFAQDLRMLQHMREVEEPFESNQIGSSAMAYKRNPMRSERVCALARHVMVLQQDTAMTASTQWFERTLDDSANRRISLAEAFLSIDAVLELCANVASGMVVYPRMIARHVMENLPFMATENILMEAVKRGGDRQVLHERIRVHSQAAASRVKADGGENDLLARIAADPAFGLSQADLAALLDPQQYTGRAARQVEAFVQNDVAPRVGDLETQREMGDIRI